MGRKYRYKQVKWAIKNPDLPADWWEKYLDKNLVEGIYHPNASFLGLREPWHEWDFEPVALHPIQCSHFGCGKTLTLRESLFGSLCIHHQPLLTHPSYINQSGPVFGDL